MLCVLCICDTTDQFAIVTNAVPSWMAIISYVSTREYPPDSSP
jgi:hypothetical protein